LGEAVYGADSTFELGRGAIIVETLPSSRLADNW
jgi:hypothetical protein